LFTSITVAPQPQLHHDPSPAALSPLSTQPKYALAHSHTFPWPTALNTLAHRPTVPWPTALTAWAHSPSYPGPQPNYGLAHRPTLPTSTGEHIQPRGSVQVHLLTAGVTIAVTPP
jgi:hypothetical protein